QAGANPATAARASPLHRPQPCRRICAPPPRRSSLRLCGARTRALALSWRFLQSLDCPAVLPDQAVDDLSALDPGVHIDRLAELVQRRSSAAEGGLQGVFGVVAGEQEVALPGHEVRGGTRDCGGEDPAG